MNEGHIGDHFELVFRDQRFRIDRRGHDQNTFNIEWINGPIERLPTWLEDRYGFTLTKTGSGDVSTSDFEKAVSSFLVGFYADAAHYFEELSQAYAIEEP